MRGCQQAHMNLRVWGCEDAGIQESSYEPEDMRMWGCRYIRKLTWTWGYEDVRMQGYKQAHMNLKIWRCKGARIQARTHEPEDMRMQGCKWRHRNLRIWRCKDAGILASTHKHKIRPGPDRKKCHLELEIGTGIWYSSVGTGMYLRHRGFRKVWVNCLTPEGGSPRALYRRVLKIWNCKITRVS